MTCTRPPSRQRAPEERAGLPVGAATGSRGWWRVHDMHTATQPPARSRGTHWTPSGRSHWESVCTQGGPSSCDFRPTLGPHTRAAANSLLPEKIQRTLAETQKTLTRPNSGPLRGHDLIGGEPPPHSVQAIDRDSARYHTRTGPLYNYDLSAVCLSVFCFSLSFSISLTLCFLSNRS